MQVLDGDSHKVSYHKLTKEFYEECNKGAFNRPIYKENNTDGELYNLDSYSLEDAWKFILDKAYKLKAQYKSSELSLILPDAFATDSSYLLSSQFSPIKMNDNSVIVPSLVNAASSFINCYTL